MKRITKIRLNSPGVVELLKSQKVAADLSARGARIKAALPTSQGEEWKQEDYIGRDRAATVVKTANYRAKETNAEQHSLAKAVSSGGGG